MVERAGEDRRVRMVRKIPHDTETRPHVRKQTHLKLKRAHHCDWFCELGAWAVEAADSVSRPCGARMLQFAGFHGGDRADVPDRDGVTVREPYAGWDRFIR
jgi:hypothetical protein